MVDDRSFKQFLDDAVKTKRPVVLVFAPEGNSLPAMLGKLKDKEELKKAKFAQSTGDKRSQLARKYKVKNTPAVLISTRGEPTELRVFEGKLEEEYLERAIGIAVRSNTKKEKKEEKKEPKGSELVSGLESEELFGACKGNSGLCIIAFIKDRREQPVARARQKPKELAPPPALQVLQQVAERVTKGQTSKRIKVSFVWVDALK